VTMIWRSYCRIIETSTYTDCYLPSNLKTPTKLEAMKNDKHSSLLVKIVNCTK